MRLLSHTHTFLSLSRSRRARVRSLSRAHSLFSSLLSFVDSLSLSIAGGAQRPDRKQRGRVRANSDRPRQGSGASCSSQDLFAGQMPCHCLVRVPPLALQLSGAGFHTPPLSIVPREPEGQYTSAGVERCRLIARCCLFPPSLVPSNPEPSTL